MERYAGFSRKQIHIAVGQHRRMYHGTASKKDNSLLKLILNHGLDPNPNLPHWNPDDKSLTSSDGIHFTSNLPLAVDHAKEAADHIGGDPILAVALIDPSTSIPDDSQVPTASELLPKAYETVFEQELDRSNAAEIAKLNSPYYHRLVDEVLIELREYFEKERNIKFDVDQLKQIRAVLDSYIRSVLNYWAYDTIKNDLTREWELSQPLLENKHERLSNILGFVTAMPEGDLDQVWVRSPIIASSKENRLLAVVKVTEDYPEVIYGTPPSDFMDELKRILEGRLD